MILWAWFACGAPEGDSDTLELDPAEELEIPSLEDVDFEASLEEAFVMALQADLDRVWRGHAEALALRQGTCPDFYAGTPDFELELDDDFPGLVWFDECESDEVGFAGWLGWTQQIAAESSVENPEFVFIEGERSLQGDGLVRQAGALVYEFDGEGADAVYVEDAGESSYYAYSSYVNGTVSEAEEMFRTEMYVVHSGGMGQTLEARGNLYWMDFRIAGRFDSVALDVEMVGAELAGEDDCTLEPRGWIGVRDEDAYWYEVVFEPRNPAEDYENDPYTECDGCGELYIRGLPQGTLVCPDFSSVWSSLTSPTMDDYALVIREVP